MTLLRDLLALAKPRPSGLAVAVTMAAYALAGGLWSSTRWLFTLVGALAIGAGANAWNQLMERESDLRMDRTAKRPLASGRLKPFHGICFATAASLLGVFLFYAGVSREATLTALLLLIVYVGVYTPLKKKSRAALYVGSVSGALTTILGWVAAGRELEAPAYALFGVLFFWQIPHFLAIGRLHREDYRRGGYTFVSQDESGAEDRMPMMIGLTGLAASAMGIYATGLAGNFYFVIALACTVIFTAASVVFQARQTIQDARRVLTLSIVYVVVLFSAMLLDRV